MVNRIIDVDSIIIDEPWRQIAERAAVEHSCQASVYRGTSSILDVIVEPVYEVVCDEIEERLDE